MFWGQSGGAELDVKLSTRTILIARPNIKATVIPHGLPANAVIGGVFRCFKRYTQREQRNSCQDSKERGWLGISKGLYRIDYASICHSMRGIF